jgi:hypothetical protein
MKGAFHFSWPKPAVQLENLSFLQLRNNKSDLVSLGTPADRGSYVLPDYAAMTKQAGASSTGYCAVADP